MNLSTRVKVTQVGGYYAAAQTARKGDIIDNAGFEGCLFIFELGTILNTGTIKAFIKGDAANSTSAMTEILGQSTYTVTATTAAYAKSCIVVDIYRADPVLHRYLEPNITLGVANTEICGITAIQYSGRVHPDTNDVTVLLSTFLNSPVE